MIGLFKIVFNFVLEIFKMVFAYENVQNNVKFNEANYNPMGMTMTMIIGMLLIIIYLDTRQMSFLIMEKSHRIQQTKIENKIEAE